jgi:hypothetical protein
LDLGALITVDKQRVSIGGHLARCAARAGRGWALRRLCGLSATEPAEHAELGGAGMAALVATATDPLQTPLFIAFHHKHEACCAVIAELVPGQRARLNELRADRDGGGNDDVDYGGGLGVGDDY